MATPKAACRLCVDRRGFLAGCAACGAGMAGMAGAWGLGTRAVFGGEPSAGAKPRIRLVFSHHRDVDGKQSEPGWPYLGCDLEARKNELLARLRQECPGTEFLPTTAYSVADAQKILEADGEVDGYLAYMIGGWARAAETIAAAGRPVIFVGDLFGASGELLVSYAAARRQGWKVVCVTSSQFGDVVQAVRVFECLKRLRSSTILVVGRGPDATSQAIEDVFGTQVVPLDFAPLNEAYAQADPDQAKSWADRWIREAEKVVEPSPEEIRKSGAMYLAMRKLMDEHQAQAIAVNCLGGFYGGNMAAYPCLGFFQLNNDGQVGACEADLESTITMLAMSYLSGRPGYISDPVIDTGANQIIYLHCVAPNKVFGPDGPTNPYRIRSHAEDRKGAAVQSLLPPGHVLTTLRFSPTRKEVIFHQSKSAGNVDDAKSCRTKLAADVQGDVDKLLGEWDQWGWHRVTFYGDLKRQVRQLSTLLGIKVVEEA